MKPKLRKQFITALKITIGLFLIVWVLSKLDWEQIRHMLQKANPLYFGGAILLFLLSQLFSVFRFDVFIRNLGIRMSFQTNSKLYLLGMFYNFFLPGGVGGDAYKAYLLSQSHEKSLKRVGKIVFLERLLGIVAIGFSLSILLLFLETPFSFLWNAIISVFGLIGVFIVLKLISRWAHAHKKRVYIGFFYSIWVQFAQILCVLFILKSFQVEGNYIAYLFLFLISNVLSVLSFAGLGIREAVFYYGAIWFQFNPDISASVAFSFSLITALVSFCGVFYLFKNLQLNS